jgi:hypothetical protein
MAYWSASLVNQGWLHYRGYLPPQSASTPDLGVHGAFRRPGALQAGRCRRGPGAAGLGP